ncbi:unnamed protein product [Mesocestoides corti]|uniref:Cadherin domain-containing protein n=1 Tax=Mesocestoides corti TaxID=53468 RepID=A0A158QVE7_MESCO|nr:unnamed protein product [Mesocestoides corti]
MSFLSVLIVLACFRCPSPHGWRIPATEVRYKLAENSPPGHFLGAVAGSSPQKGVTNSFGAPSQLFQLDPLTSELYLKSEIDAEKLCALATRREDEKGGPNGGLTDVVTCTPSTGELSVQLDVNSLLPDGSLQAVFRVTVEILDVDDNPPRFDHQTVWSRHLKEALYRKGRKIDLPKARDIDLLPQHRNIQYILEQNPPSAEGVFHFEVSERGTPTLVLLKDLDAETQEFFNMTVVAFNPPRSSHGKYTPTRASTDLESRLRVEIYVVDTNDNEPYFEKTSYNVTVPENTLPGTTIFHLKAHDEDRTAKLEYFLVESESSTTSATTSTFEVEKSGRVVLRRNLDFESRQTYRLPVRVTDGDFSADSTLNVVVADVNDEAPRFELNPIHLVVEEGASAKRSIGQLRVYDPDSVMVNGVVRCKEPEEWAHRQALTFSPDPQTHPTVGLYDLQTRVELDREGSDTVEGGYALVRLVCWDGNELQTGGPRLTATMTTTLTIKDINDNRPTFSEPIYHVNIAENNHLGAKIIQVEAYDPDDGENAEVTYSLLDHANFHVDPVSGWVTAATEFDREKRDSYQVTIIASDSGFQRLTSSALLNVTILDQNDNAPVLLPCDKVSNPLVIWENSPVGSLVGHLVATDADTGRNGEVVFKLPQKSSSSSPFELQPNGSLFTALPLDREQTVRDRGGPNALSTSETVCIRVLDENDNDPHFVLPDRLYSHDDWLADSSPAYLWKRESVDVGAHGTKLAKTTDPVGAEALEPSLSVSIHETNGQLITRLEATDPDEGPNGQVVYALQRHAQSRARVNRAAGDFLTVDTATGEVWLRRSLQEEDLGPHVFVVSAKDQGTPMSRFENKLLLVLVEDIPPRALDRGASSSFVASSGDGGALASLFPFKLGERKNVLLLVGLISVSVVLATVLIAAMICMLRPCRSLSRQPRRFFSQHRMSPSGAANCSNLQVHSSTNGVISPQETRLIDNASADNFVGHDYGYGTTNAQADIIDSDGWLGDGKGTFRVVNADTTSAMSEEAGSRRPQLWTKYNSLPRDRCGSPFGLAQDNACSTAAGLLMTPLNEMDEMSHDASHLRPAERWTAVTLAADTNFQSSEASHIAVPVTLLPAVCFSPNLAQSVVTASNPFTMTTFQPSGSKSHDMEVLLAREREHASDSGQGGSDEDIHGNPPPPVINLVKSGFTVLEALKRAGGTNIEALVRGRITGHPLCLAVPYKLAANGEEDPWKRAGGCTRMSTDDLLRLTTKRHVSSPKPVGETPPGAATVPDLVSVAHRRLPDC